MICINVVNIHPIITGKHDPTMSGKHRPAIDTRWGYKTISLFSAFLGMQQLKPSDM